MTMEAIITIITSAVSGKIDIRNEHQRLSPLRLWVRFPVRPIPRVIERATLRGLKIPPTLHYKTPNIVYRGIYS
jgi:hypothetical protein